jgi:hypothetical protein
MDIFKKVVLLVLLFSNTGSYSLIAQNGAPSIPDFTLFRQDKSSFTQKDLAKDKLLFFLFFDVTCIHCQQAVLAINKKYSQMVNTNIHLVTLDPPAEVNAFLKKYGNNLIDKKNVMLFFDLRSEFITRFKPRKYPSIFLYSSNRNLIIYDDNPENLPKFFKEIKSRAGN